MRRTAATLLGLAVCAFGLGTPTATSAAGVDGFLIRGAGWGHGVGMSQWGAYQQARVGRTARTILTHYYQGATLSALDDSRLLRVNIGYQVGSAKLRAVSLEDGGGSFAIAPIGQVPFVVRKSPSVSFTADGSQVVATVSDSTGVLRSYAAPRLIIRWSGARNSWGSGTKATAMEIAKNGSQYRTSARYRYGEIEVSANDSRLNVVNILRIHDEYLPGISEVSASWPIHALQAQAVAARSYALSKTSIRTACQCHSDDGSGPYYDQTFIGYARATSYLGGRWLLAVRSTTPDDKSGMALSYRGQPIPAFYYASSGGRTANSEDAWGGYLPWARSVADPWSLDAAENPYRAWTKTKSASAMASAFGLPNVASVAVTARYASGQVRSVAARSASGQTATLTGSQFMSRLGLLSKWVQSVT